jgi:hypothetical protein
LQYLFELKKYQNQVPFDPVMTYFRKRIKLEIVNALNEKITQYNGGDDVNGSVIDSSEKTRKYRMNICSGDEP